MPIKYNSHINYALAVLNALQQVYQPFTPVLKARHSLYGFISVPLKWDELNN